MRKTVGLVILICVVVGGTAYYAKRGTAEIKNVHRVAAITRGNLVSTIGATGTLEPEDLVDVGAQVAGRITGFGKDASGKTIDYNSVVKAGMELAYIDRTPYEASLAQAEAALEKSQADLLILKAKAEQTEREWKRAESLRPTNAIADSDYDTALSEYKQAKANVAVGEATIKQNKAALDMARVNLNYTTIQSPVDGTIIARRVNVGQTVVASLSAPSLFLIAKDLTRMQVWASVNEADIGRIKVGMPVQFTVDAYPGENFVGKVIQVRMNATMTQNVVTYMVIVTTDNSDGRLLPYLTATVLFEVSRRSNVLLAPNAALRWQPDAAQIAPDSKTASSSATPDATTDHAATSSNDNTERGALWVAGADGLVHRVDVAVGATDDVVTEVSGDGVKEGMKVVVGTGASNSLETNGAATGDSGESGDEVKNPFLPKPPKGRRPPPQP